MWCVTTATVKGIWPGCVTSLRKQRGVTGAEKRGTSFETVELRQTPKDKAVEDQEYRDEKLEGQAKASLAHRGRKRLQERDHQRGCK